MASEEQTEPIDAPPRFNGWLRICGQRWAIAAQGQTDREASDRLDRVIQERGPGHYDLAVLPEGKRP